MFFSSFLILSNSYALERKFSSPFDFRIKTVKYNELDTVQIDGVAGIVTHIQVSKGEQHLSHAFGDDGGWAFASQANNFFIKPKEEDSDTNLIIVTNKHTYHILLHYIGGGVEKDSETGKIKTTFAPTPWQLRQATLDLKYIYPDEDNYKKDKNHKEQQIQYNLSDYIGNGIKNFAYRMTNDPKSRSISPTNIWDNYEFTFFRFEKNQELPTIYAINSSGKETMVNFNVVEGNIIIVQQIAKEWRIRYGDKVIGVLNDGYNPNNGSLLKTNTISSNVKRVIKQNDGDEEDEK